MEPHLFDEFNGFFQKKPEVIVEEIKALVQEIVQHIQRFDPLVLLQLAFFKFAEAHTSVVSESDQTFDKAMTVQVIEYIQCVLASVKLFVSQIVPSEEDYQKLHQMVSQLYLQVLYHSLSVITPTTTLGRSEFSLLSSWCFIRKKRHSIHDEPYLKMLLLPHDAIFRKLFNFSVADFIDGIMQIAYSLNFGYIEAYQQMQELQVTIEQIRQEKYAGQPFDSDIVNKITDELGLREKADVLGGKLFGNDLFDIQKITRMPEDLLNLLSWSEGEEKNFFAGDHAGWPLQVLPTFLRPFLKINGRYYCHDMGALVDNLYRSIQKIIIKLCPQYGEQWNTIQEQTSVKLTKELLVKLLPNARIIEGAFYKSTAKKGEFDEVDLLVLIDKHLLVIELKAGAITWTSPFHDPKAYEAGTKSLISSPRKQAKKFFDCLQKGAVTLFRTKDEGDILDSLALSQFENTSLFGITVDDLEFTLKKAEALHNQRTDNPFLSLSISDLMMFADVFKSEITFLHFLEVRKKAACSPFFNMITEVDHLGLYFTFNDYVQKSKEIREEHGHFDGIVWEGYGKVVEQYFFDIMVGEPNPIRPSQDMPPIILNLLEILRNAKPKDYFAIGMTILNYSYSERMMLSQFIERVDKEHYQFTSDPLNICVFIGEHSDNVIEQYTLASMIVARQEKRLSLILKYSNGKLISAFGRVFDRSSYTPEALNFFNDLANSLRSRRIKEKIDNRKQHGIKKIGVNEPCPCGSGSKYKKCCLKR